MSYGTLQGIKDEYLQYDQTVTTGQLSDAITNRFLIKATNQINVVISAIPGAVLPLAVVPDILNDIAEALAICLILKRFSISKDPDDTKYVQRYCDDPLKKLDEYIAKNPGEFTGAASQNLMLSNTVGDDRNFTVTVQQGGTTVGDPGTTEDW